MTHQIHLLQQCDLVIVLEDGLIKALGTYSDLENSGLDIEALIPQKPLPTEETIKEKSLQSITSIDEIKQLNENTEEIENEIELEVNNDIETNDNNETNISKDASIPQTKLVSRNVSTESKSSIATKLKNKEKNASADNRKLDNRSSNLITIEEKKTGDVSLSTYSYYIKAGGIISFINVCLFLILAQVFQLLSTFWLSHWGTVALRHSIANNPLSESTNIYYLNFYAMFCCLFLISFVMRSLLLAQFRLGTSKVLHENLLLKVLGAPVAFFDITPLGRILNRFVFYSQWLV